MPTAKIWLTGGAASYVAFPAWLAVTVQVPALLIVIVPLENVHAPPPLKVVAAAGGGRVAVAIHGVRRTG